MNWKYMFDPSSGGSVEESGSDLFTGKFYSGDGTAEAEASFGRVVFDAFFISSDEMAEYAIGTFYWISGEEDRIALMRDLY